MKGRPVDSKGNLGGGEKTWHEPTSEVARKGREQLQAIKPSSKQNWKSERKQRPRKGCNLLLEAAESATKPNTRPLPTARRTASEMKTTGTAGTCLAAVVLGAAFLDGAVAGRARVMEENHTDVVDVGESVGSVIGEYAGMFDDFNPGEMIQDALKTGLDWSVNGHQYVPWFRAPFWGELAGKAADSVTDLGSMVDDLRDFPGVNLAELRGKSPRELYDYLSAVFENGSKDDEKTGLCAPASLTIRITKPYVEPEYVQGHTLNIFLDAGFCELDKKEKMLTCVKPYMSYSYTPKFYMSKAFYGKTVLISFTGKECFFTTEKDGISGCVDLKTKEHVECSALPTYEFSLEKFIPDSYVKLMEVFEGLIPEFEDYSETFTFAPKHLADNLEKISKIDLSYEPNGQLREMLKNVGKLFPVNIPSIGDILRP